MSMDYFIKDLCNLDANGNPVTYHVVNSTHGPYSECGDLPTLE